MAENGGKEDLGSFVFRLEPDLDHLRAKLAQAEQMIKQSTSRMGGKLGVGGVGGAGGAGGGGGLVNNAISTAIGVGAAGGIGVRSASIAATAKRGSPAPAIDVAAIQQQIRASTDALAGTVAASGSLTQQHLSRVHRQLAVGNRLQNRFMKRGGGGGGGGGDGGAVMNENITAQGALSLGTRILSPPPKFSAGKIKAGKTQFLYSEVSASAFSPQSIGLTTSQAVQAVQLVQPIQFGGGSGGPRSTQRGTGAASYGITPQQAQNIISPHAIPTRQPPTKQPPPTVFSSPPPQKLPRPRPPFITGKDYRDWARAHDWSGNYPPDQIDEEINRVWGPEGGGGGFNPNTRKGFMRMPFPQRGPRTSMQPFVGRASWARRAAYNVGSMGGMLTGRPIMPAGLANRIGGQALVNATRGLSPTGAVSLGGKIMGGAAAAALQLPLQGAMVSGGLKAQGYNIGMFSSSTGGYASTQDLINQHAGVMNPVATGAGHLVSGLGLGDPFGTATMGKATREIAKGQEVQQLLDAQKAIYRSRFGVADQLSYSTGAIFDGKQYDPQLTELKELNAQTKRSWRELQSISGGK
jgi:hypothetical protein